MPDAVWTGGITASLCIAMIADGHHLTISPGATMKPLRVLASEHATAVAPAL